MTLSAATTATAASNCMIYRQEVKMIPLEANLKYSHSIFLHRPRTIITIHDSTDGFQPKI